MGATEAIPALLPLLSDPEAGVRRRAAEALCALGSREGVDALFKESGNLAVLNRLRRPEAWEKLRSLKPAATLKGPIRSVFVDVVRPAGMAVEWPAAPSDEAKFWMAERQMIRAGDGDSVLDKILALCYGPSSVILEGDRLRVVPDAEADAFWKAWGDAEHRK